MGLQCVFCQTKTQLINFIQLNVRFKGLNSFSLSKTSNILHSNSVIIFHFRNITFAVLTASRHKKEDVQKSRISLSVSWP